MTNESEKKYLVPLLKRGSLNLILKGYAIGTAESIPGVSGSVIALVLGLYRYFISLLNRGVELVIETIKYPLGFSTREKLTKANQQFAPETGLPLLLGIAAAFISSAFIMTWFLENYRQEIYAVFMGFVVGTLYIPTRSIQQWKWHLPAIIASVALFFGTIFWATDHSVVDDPSIPLLIFAGITSISATIVPAVSGSLVLVILGLYDYIFLIIQQISTLSLPKEDWISITIYGLSNVLGLVTVGRLIEYLYKHHPDELMAIITGLLLASLVALWPFLNADETGIIPFWEAGETVQITLFTLMIGTGLLASAIIAHLPVEQGQLEEE